jgi:hypothetical protein
MIIAISSIFPGCIETDEIHFELIIHFIPDQEIEFEITLPGLLLLGNISQEFLHLIERSNIDHTFYNDNNGTGVTFTHNSAIDISEEKGSFDGLTTEYDLSKFTINQTTSYWYHSSVSGSLLYSCDIQYIDTGFEFYYEGPIREGWNEIDPWVSDWIE